MHTHTHIYKLKTEMIQRATIKYIISTLKETQENYFNHETRTDLSIKIS